MPKEPIIRTPLTDVTGFLFTHQGTRCSDLEMKVMNCFEAYGHIKALKACEDLMYDYKECFLGQKKDKRIQEMRAERHRQYRAGERPKSKLFAQGPELDSFQMY